MYRTVEIHIDNIEEFLNSMWNEGFKLQQIVYKENNIYLIALKRRYLPCI